jgi:hypothetical protein
MKEFILKLLSREFILLVLIEVYIMALKSDLLLDTNNIILITSLLGLTTVKKFIDNKSGKTLEVESIKSKQKDETVEVTKEMLQG